MSHKLYYISANAEVPVGRVSSTARKGSKWYGLVGVGDVVDLAVTGTDEVFGRATVVFKEQMSYADVLSNASHNHVAFRTEDVRLGRNEAAAALEVALDACYGRSTPDDTFTVLHILPLNEAPPTLSDEEQAQLTGVIREFQALAIAGQAANKQKGQPWVRAVEFTQSIGEIATVHRVEF